MGHFARFCATYTVGDPFPVQELLLCYFASYLAQLGLAPQTIKCYLAGVRGAQISMGLPDPREQSSLPLLKRVQAGISRIRQQSGGKSSRVRLPITTRVLERLYGTWVGSANPDKTMLWTVAAMAFFGFFRLGELLPESVSAWDAAVNLAWGDVAVDNLAAPAMVQIHLKRSKCDQEGNGADVVVGRTGTNICPVEAICAYLRIRGPAQGPFFKDHEGRTVTKVWFTQQLRVTLQGIGLPSDQYAGHSFRIGAATSAALAGMEDSLIQTLGRWHSAAFLRYIRTPKARLAGASAALVRTRP